MIDLDEAQQFCYQQTNRVVASLNLLSDQFFGGDKKNAIAGVRVQMLSGALEFATTDHPQQYEWSEIKMAVACGVDDMLAGLRRVEQMQAVYDCAWRAEDVIEDGEFWVGEDTSPDSNQLAELKKAAKKNAHGSGLKKNPQKSLEEVLAMTRTDVFHQTLHKHINTCRELSAKLNNDAPKKLRC